MSNQPTPGAAIRDASATVKAEIERRLQGVHLRSKGSRCISILGGGVFRWEVVVNEPAMPFGTVAIRADNAFMRLVRVQGLVTENDGYRLTLDIEVDKLVSEKDAEAVQTSFV